MKADSANSATRRGTVLPVPRGHAKTRIIQDDLARHAPFMRQYLARCGYFARTISTRIHARRRGCSTTPLPGVGSRRHDDPWYAIHEPGRHGTRVFGMADPEGCQWSLAGRLVEAGQTGQRRPDLVQRNRLVTVISGRSRGWPSQTNRINQSVGTMTRPGFQVDAWQFTLSTNQRVPSDAWATTFQYPKGGPPEGLHPPPYHRPCSTCVWPPRPPSAIANPSAPPYDGGAQP